jgi:hypothetical protein
MKEVSKTRLEDQQQPMLFNARHDHTSDRMFDRFERVILIGLAGEELWDLKFMRLDIY